MYNIILTYIALLLLCFGTSIGICQSQNVGTIQGQVTDKQNNPLSEYTVSTISQIDKVTYAAKTDSGGQFSLTNLPAGTWDVQVRHLSALLSQREVTITENTEVNADFVIEGIGVISGFLLDSVNRLPLPITDKIEIGLLNSDDELIERTFQGEVSNGYFKVNHLLSGHYQIRDSFDGYVFARPDSYQMRVYPNGHVGGVEVFLKPGASLSDSFVDNVVLDPELVPPDATLATAIIFTDSPRTPQVYLTIVAASKRFATLSADICDFGQILSETTHEKKIKLCVNAPLNLQEVRLMPSAHPSLTWKMSPDLNSECYLITIQLRAPKKLEPDTAEKLFTSILTVAFPNERTLSLPIAARIVRPVTVQPQTLSYGAVDKDANPSAEFTLSAKKNFKVLSIQVPNFLQVAAPDDWSQSLHAYNAHAKQEKRYKVFWDVANSPELLREEIKVLTTAETMPITIPVYGLIRATEGETHPTTKR